MRLLYLSGTQSRNFVWAEPSLLNLYKTTQFEWCGPNRTDGCRLPSSDRHAHTPHRSGLTDAHPGASANRPARVSQPRERAGSTSATAYHAASHTTGIRACTK